MLVISIAYTYILTPQLSSMGMSLDMFANTTSTSASMTAMHLVYWSLAVLISYGDPDKYVWTILT